MFLFFNSYRSTNFAGAYVTALGWGATGFGEATSNSLLKVQLNIQTNEACLQHYPGRISSSQVCTYADGKDSCQVKYSIFSASKFLTYNMLYITYNI